MIEINAECACLGRQFARFQNVADMSVYANRTFPPLPNGPTPHVLVHRNIHRIKTPKRAGFSRGATNIRLSSYRRDAGPSRR
jgi:hypothetical protein